jgi:transcriptional regulator with XRE-family HTH domain
VGNRLRELREELGWKQSDLAKLLNIERAAVSKLETGRTPLTDDRIIFLSEYFKVSTDYLLNRTKIRTTPKELSLSPEIVEVLEVIKDFPAEALASIRGLASSLDSKNNQEPFSHQPKKDT